MSGCGTATASGGIGFRSHVVPHPSSPIPASPHGSVRLLEQPDAPPSQQFASDLAKARQMRVFIYPEEIVFRPELTKSPPQILKRGVIELQFNQTSDLHTFDSQGTSFDP